MTLIQGINVQTDRYIRLQLILTKAVTQAEEEHRELFRLYVERETDKAVRYLRDHILNAKQALVDAIGRTFRPRRLPKIMNTQCPNRSSKFESRWQPFRSASTTLDCCA